MRNGLITVSYSIVLIDLNVINLKQPIRERTFLLDVSRHYEVCLKSNCTNNFYHREKSIAFYNVTMSYGFENQISAFCDNYIFLYVFLSRHFFVTVL